MNVQTPGQRPGASVSPVAAVPSVLGDERCGPRSQRTPPPRGQGGLMSLSTTDLIIAGAIAAVIVVLVLALWLVGRRR